MQQPEDDARPTLFDLEELELDPSPAFIIKVGTSAIEFDLLYTNETFRNSTLREHVLSDTPTAGAFRTWAQAFVQSRDSKRDFAGCTWFGEVTKKGGALKVIKATEMGAKDQGSQHQNGQHTTNKARVTVYERPGNDVAHVRPDTSLSSRLESLQTMMEMSDVGVFEYSTDGVLLHANEAYYRLSSYPRDVEGESEYAFANAIHPEDRDVVMSMWNTLAHGSPVTFEMRWKARPGSNDAAQWTLCSCLPIFDENNTVIAVGGNIIDINAQKKSHDATQARLDALEQARLSELKFTRFAQLSPIAIYIFVPNTGIRFVNDQFFELTGHMRAPDEQIDWFDLVVDEDIKSVEDNWADMLSGKRTDGIQFRLKKPWIDQDGVCSNTWVQSSSYPETDEQGNVISIMGTLFDISHFKWAEDVQRRRVDEALEAKRQQENFIDMTSHELRNPLSAVIQCAESVISTLGDLNERVSGNAHDVSTSGSPRDDIESSLDALQTIVSCSLHQKRIIDDVLTLSKLDSNLILITPVRVQPTIILAGALKMFEVECLQMGIKLDLIEDDTYKGFDWVMLDPSRLLQILINLLTNAIKFTKDQPKRWITVKLGGSWTRPPKVWQSVTFSTDDGPKPDNIFERPEWGDGPKGYLWVKVSDTGCGMTGEEQDRLFSRFSQATPRTHVKYGGSGLGLFISKSLATLQGGAIGVFSEAGVGSTFGFYVATRMADAPAVSRRVSQRPLSLRTRSAEGMMKAANLHVLIVEDNLINQKVLKKQLQKLGWIVSVAGNGQEALDWLKGSVYWRGDEPDPGPSNTTDGSKHSGPKANLDIVLMDVEMPIMDGITCARIIRQYEEQGLLGRPPVTPRGTDASPVLQPGDPDYEEDSPLEGRGTRLPILAVSANARMEQLQETLAAGMDGAITKPFRIPELWPKIQELIPRLAGVNESRWQD